MLTIASLRATGTARAFPAADSSPGWPRLWAGAMLGRLPAAARAAEATGGLHGVPLRGMYLTQQEPAGRGPVRSHVQEAPGVRAP